MPEDEPQARHGIACLGNFFHQAPNRIRSRRPRTALIGDEGSAQFEEDHFLRHARIVACAVAERRMK